jgi:hypothetical protein
MYVYGYVFGTLSSGAFFTIPKLRVLVCASFPSP